MGPLTVQEEAGRMRIAAVVALFLVAGAAAAQGMSGKASLGYLATSGNAESTSANAKLNLLLDREPWSHELDLNAISATSSDVTTAEAYAAGYEARLEFSERTYLFTALDWERDRFSSYDQRLSESIGFGRRVVDSDRHVLNIDIGAGGRQLKLVDGTEESDAIVRAGLDYVWTISETTSFNQDVTAESGSSNTSVVSVSELRARMFANVALVLSYRIKRNSEVLPGAAKTDRFTSVSLEYAF
jgi:putative salt-induced outer membrane protein